MRYEFLWPKAILTAIAACREYGLRPKWTYFHCSLGRCPRLRCRMAFGQNCCQPESVQHQNPRFGL
jgi:hypothetical protein